MLQKHPKTLVLATHNAGKVAELRSALAPLGWNLLGLDDFNLPTPEETGTTFEENALIKAQAAHTATGLWSLADDSGLEVEFLQGGPGVDTATYGGWKHLLDVMDHLPDSERRARFVCTLALVRNDTPPLILKGFCQGYISRDPRGTEGFGYDPVFIPEGDTHTFAEMTKTEKSHFSHRGMAVRALYEWLQALPGATL